MIFITLASFKKGGGVVPTYTTLVWSKLSYNDESVFLIDVCTGFTCAYTRVSNYLVSSSYLYTNPSIMNYINICEYKSKYAVMTTAKKEDENFDCPEFLENNIYKSPLMN